MTSRAIAALQVRWPMDSAGPGVLYERILALTQGEPYSPGARLENADAMFQAWLDLTGVG